MRDQPREKCGPAVRGRMKNSPAVKVRMPTVTTARKAGRGAGGSSSNRCAR